MLLQRPRAGVIDERRRAAEPRCLSGAGIIEFVKFCTRNLLVIPPECPAPFISRFQFVVADEERLAIGPGKRRHAIVFAGHPQPIVHHLTGS